MFFWYYVLESLYSSRVSFSSNDNPFSLFNATQILSIVNLLLCTHDRSTPPRHNTKPWNRNSSLRASKIGCRMQHIIKKASILEASAARRATKPYNRGEVGVREKFQHCLQNRVPRVQVLLPLPSSR